MVEAREEAGVCADGGMMEEVSSARGTMVLEKPRMAIDTGAGAEARAPKSEVLARRRRLAIRLIVCGL